MAAPLKAFNLKRWIDEHRDRLRPPVGAGAERLTVNVKVVVPALPSFNETSLIVRFGAASSLTIVPCPWPSVTFAPVTLVTLTKKVSLVSGVVSPLTRTVKL